MRPVAFDGIRVVVFDLDDTLYAEREFVYSGYRAVAVWMADRVPLASEQLYERLRALFDTPARPRVFNHLLAELDLASHASEWVPTMIEVYRRHRPAITLLPDAERAFQRWYGPFAMALITDGDPDTQQGKIEALGLPGRLDTLVLTGRWGREFWKPHPRGFEYVEQKYEAREKELVYVADNPVKDFISPRRRGWRTLRVRRPGGIYSATPSDPAGRPEAEVESLDEVTLSS